MHEARLVRDLLAKIEEIADEEHADHVEGVKIEIGAMSHAPLAVRARSLGVHEVDRRRGAPRLRHPACVGHRRGVTSRKIHRSSLRAEAMSEAEAVRRRAHAMQDLPTFLSVPLEPGAVQRDNDTGSLVAFGDGGES